MTRRQSTDRLEQLVEAGGKVFLALGYRRAQMADIAREMGVAPGTLYLYVESKEALFDLVLRRALGENDPPSVLPIPATSPEAILERAAARFRRPGLKVLRAALAQSEPENVRAEFEAVVREIYSAIHRLRFAIKLVERSALDWPELARLFYAEGRKEMLGEITRYLELRTGQGRLRPMPDAAVAARLINETCAWFAMHRYGDYDAAGIDAAVAEQTVIQALVNAFTYEPETVERGDAG